MGDAVLEATARLLQDLARPYDLVARIGGEEFIVMLPATTLEQGVSVAERLRAEVAELKVAKYPRRITASFGVATAQPGLPLPELLRQADDALYRAKGAGRDRVST
jgi:diguanylate cyclase (GGDEF)-like protein